MAAVAALSWGPGILVNAYVVDGTYHWNSFPRINARLAAVH